MKLLRVIASMDPAKGGPCQGIRNTIPELERLGVENEVVCMDDPAAPYLKDAFIVHALGPKKGPWYYTPKLIPWLLENLHRFDAVIVHGLWLYHGYAVREASRLFRNKMPAAKSEGSKIPKFFVMPHGMLDPYFQRATGRKLKAIRNWIYWKLIERKIVNEAMGLLFTCEAELELAKIPFRPYKPKQAINVGYGIAKPPTFTHSMNKAFLAQCPGLESDSYFLFLGRIHEKKGVDILIKAYAEILREMTEVNADASLPGAITINFKNVNGRLRIPKLVIAGPGMETSYGQKIKKMVDDEPLLHDSVFFPGMLTGDVKWSAFYGCQAFILPSHQENFGIAIVEALACGKPVLISNQVNIWREIEREGGGIVAYDTLDGVFQLLYRWIHLPQYIKTEMSNKAEKIYKKHFAIDHVSKQLLKAIDF